MQRVHVMGVSGSGKTTFAAQLAAQLNIPHVELDALFWEADWTPAPLAVFRQRVTEALRGASWVTDGNYSKARDLVWARADTIIWLDFALPLVMARLLRRTIMRIVRQDVLWNGCRETVAKSFFSRDSILLWALQTYPRHRKQYPALLAQPEYAHLCVVHLKSPALARAWLATQEQPSLDKSTRAYTL